MRVPVRGQALHADTMGPKPFPNAESRQQRRRLRACAHQLRVRPAGEAGSKKQHWLQGRLAYLSMLNPGQSEGIGQAPSPLF